MKWFYNYSKIKFTILKIKLTKVKLKPTLETGAAITKKNGFPVFILFAMSTEK